MRKFGSAPERSRCRNPRLASQSEPQPFLRRLRARRLIARGIAGILVPSFAPGAAPHDENLVLWDWSGRPPHQVTVFDPSGRLPRNQLSWDEC